MLDLQRTRKIWFCRQLGDRFPRNFCTRDAEFEASVYPDVHACTHVITHVAHCAIRAWTHFLINTYVIKFGTVITGITCVLVPPFLQVRMRYPPLFFFAWTSVVGSYEYVCACVCISVCIYMCVCMYGYVHVYVYVYHVSWLKEICHVPTHCA